MLNNVALNVCIGIVFIVLLYSLLATILQEMVARCLGLRARFLLKAIRRMLQDGAPKKKSIVRNYLSSLADSLKRYFIKPLDDNSFPKAFYDDALIKYLAEDNFFSKPSYIAPPSFSQTVIHLLQNSAPSQNPMAAIGNNLAANIFPSGFTIGAETLTCLKRLWAQSDGDINKFDVNLQGWYNNMMLRVTGWYKRQTQFILFIIGFALAASFNIDLIAVGKILSRDDKARAEIVNMAIDRQKTYQVYIDKDSQKNIKINDQKADSAYTALQGDAESVNKILGLGYQQVCTSDKACLEKVAKKVDSICAVHGWNVKTARQVADDFTQCSSCKEKISPYQPAGQRYAGWLLTAFAISLGAPFWFDLLNKIMLLRGSKKMEVPGSNTGKKDNQQQTPVNPLG